MKCGAYLVLTIFYGLTAMSQPSGDSKELYNGSNNTVLYSQNGKIGLQKSKTKPITPAVYDTLFQLNASRYVGRRYVSSKQQLMWGIIDETGKKILPFKYRKLIVTDDWIIAGYQDNNKIDYGVYSLDGKELIKPRYNSIYILSSSYLAASKGDQIFVFNKIGTKTLQVEADSMRAVNNSYSLFYRRGKVGLLKLNGAQVLAAEYQDIKIANDEILVQNYPKWNFITGYDTISFNEEKIIEWEKQFIVTNNNKSWLMSADGQVISSIYDSFKKVNRSFSIVDKEGRWGVVNNFGHEVINLNYSEIINDEEVIYSRNRASKKKWLLFDHYGYQKTMLEYDSVNFMVEGRIPIKRNGKWGFLDRFGIEVISPIFDKVSQFRDGLSIVTFYGEDGIINREGKWIVLPEKLKISTQGNSTLLIIYKGQYQVKSFAGDLIYFSRNKMKMTSFGFVEYDSINSAIIRKISWHGTVIQHTEAEANESTMAGGAGLLVFKANDKFGFKDQKGRIVIANRYEEVRPFNQNMAAIKINNKWGFIDLDENLIIQPRYDSVAHFDRGFCITNKNKFLGVVNLTGEEILKNQYQQIVLLSNGRFRVLKNNYWGVLNGNGAVVIHEKYNSLLPVKQNYYIVERNGKYGTINLGGVNKIPMLYDFIGYNKQTETLTTKLSYKKEWAFLMKTHSINN